MTAQDWTRFALTGDVDATAPGDAALAPIVSAVTADLLAANPCVGDPAQLSTADAAVWVEWLGYAVAGRYARTPAGRKFLDATTEVKIGPITRKRQGIDLTTFYADLARGTADARSRMSCIGGADGTLKANRGNWFGSAGYRQANER